MSQPPSTSSLAPPKTIGSSLSPSPQKVSTGSATGNPRNKCALKPGHSLMDWIRLGSSGVDLSGTKGAIVPVSSSELAKHCTQTDAWMAIRGKVYNVTRYMDFHPGGVDELMKGVGKDATKLFDEVHAWVNYEQLLAKCFIGPLRNVVNLDFDPFKSTKVPVNNRKKDDKEFKMPNDVLPQGQQSKSATTTEITPRFDWIQKMTELTLIFYTKSLCNPGLIATRNSETELVIRVITGQITHLYIFVLSRGVNWPCRVKASSETGKVELNFTKSQAELWTSLGKFEIKKISQYEDLKFEYKVSENVKINHDSHELVLESDNDIMLCPIGHHFSLSDDVNGETVTRSYTPVPGTFLPDRKLNSNGIGFLIKSYPQGLLSKHIASRSTNSVLSVSQPKGNFQLSKLVEHRRIGLIAAGSGITPILAVLTHLLARTNNKVEQIELVLFNKTEQDIWCRDVLESNSENGKRLNISYVLSEADDSWTGRRGRISESIVSNLTNQKSNQHVSFCCVCGPPAFNELTEKLFRDAEFEDSHLHFF